MNGIFLTTTFQWDWKCCLCICPTRDLTAFAILCIPHISEKNLCVCRRRWPFCFIREWEQEDVGEEGGGIAKSFSPNELSAMDLFSEPWLQTVTLGISWEISTCLLFHSPNFRASLFVSRSLTVSLTMVLCPVEGDSSPLGDDNCRVVEFQCWNQS